VIARGINVAYKRPETDCPKILTPSVIPVGGGATEMSLPALDQCLTDGLIMAGVTEGHQRSVV
jgi:hypothetical protein